MIRKAKEEDFEGVLRIFREVQNLHAENEPNIFKFCDPIDFSRFKEMLNEESMEIFVADDGEQILGFLVGVIINMGSNLTLPRKVFGVENLAVSKHAQKSGVGESLMKKAIQFANEEKCDSVNLSVWVFNENAKGFYKHLGFKEKSIKMQLDL